MSSKATIALVTLVTTTTGCYSTWDIAPRSLVRLDGFREGQTRQLEAAGPDRDEVPFTSGTELRLRDVSGAEGTAHLRAADVRGPILIAVERDGIAPFSVDLTRLAAVQAKNFSPGKTAGLAVGLGLGVPAAAFGIFVAVLASSGGFGGGRPLRVSGQASPVRVRLRLDRAARGARPSRAPSMDDVTRARLLAHWASEASAECASVPAFLALARDLELASAPGGLVAHALRAAGEEAAHTRLCTALASEHAGAAIVARTPPTPPNRDADSQSLLERLALEAFWDGCVAEGLAATLARRSAPLANDEGTGRALRTIARDEHGHRNLST